MNIEQINKVIELSRSPQIKLDVAEVIYRMPKDYWHFRYVKKLITGASRNDPWFDLHTFLHSYARTFKPNIYLEVGVRKGGSMSQVISQSPNTSVFGFDLWPPDYCIEKGWEHIPSSPEIVTREMKQFKPNADPAFMSGSSAVTLPRFFAQHPNFVADLATVDGDHSLEGGRFDLEQVFPHAKVIAFDDITHPAHGYLDQVFDEVVQKKPVKWVVVKDKFDVGTALAFRVDE